MSATITPKKEDIKSSKSSEVPCTDESIISVTKKCSACNVPEETQRKNGNTYRLSKIGMGFCLQERVERLKSCLEQLDTRWLRVDRDIKEMRK